MSYSQQIAATSKDMEKILLHQLALGPATEADLFKHKFAGLSDRDFISIFDNIAVYRDGKWKLTGKAFTRLDVFSFDGYSSHERQVAIQNAVRSYDQMKLDTSDPAWERLLPHKDRGTGKCLSKSKAKITTPKPKAANVDQQSSIRGGSHSLKRARMTDDDDHDDDVVPATKRTRLGPGSSSESDVSSLSAEILDLSSPASTRPTLRSDIAHLVEEKRKLAEKNAKLNKERSTLFKEKQQLKKEKHQLTREKSQLMREKTQFEEKNTLLEEVTLRRQEQSYKHVKNIEALEAKLKHSDEKLTTFESVAKAKDDRIRQLEKQKSDSDVRFGALRKHVQGFLNAREKVESTEQDLALLLSRLSQE